MPSDAFIGVLTGLGQAHRERQKNIFDQEVERRDQLAKSLEKLAEQPDIAPEGKEQLYRQAFGIRTHDIHKKLPKELEGLATEVAPKFGQSWLGGQTSRQVEATNMPIPSDLEGGASLKDIQGGQVPGLEDKVQATRTPPHSQYQVPMPTPPPGAQRSIFTSPAEAAHQKMAAAVELLQALGPIQQQQAVNMERAKLAMQPPEVRSAPPESMLYQTDPGTGQVTIIHTPDLKPAKPPTLNAPRFENKLVEGYSRPQEVFRITDPDAPDFSKEYITGPGGQRIDVTGKTSVYEKPPSTVANFNLNNPGGGTDTVSYWANQIEDDPQNWNLLGGDKKLQQQVRAELAIRGRDVNRLTAATKQLGETADTIVPKIDAMIKKLDDPKIVAALGPVMGRWNEFWTGGIGTNDPDLAAIRSQIGLTQTGVMRAHVGARGGSGLLEKFEGLANSTRMDAATLKGSLKGMRDFLQGYRDRIHPRGAAPTPPPSSGAGEAPAGVDQALWNAMTPQERSLWK